MPEAEKPKVQEVPADQVPAEPPVSTHFLKVDRSLRPEGFHIEGNGTN
jgi:hypothetical protein